MASIAIGAASGRARTQTRRRASPRSRWARAGRAIVVAPLAIRFALAAIVLLALWASLNWAYHVVRKPAELLFPLSGALAKSPAETWRQYEPLFRRHSTAVMTPELLAALAQVEAAGNPAARTYWRWRFTWSPFELYQPASSAVGMYQMTDATFREARRYCIQDHVAIEAESSGARRPCWFNGLYTRVVPSHAIEMTSAWLDRNVVTTLARQRMTRTTLQQRQDLAAVIHLCGGGAGDAYAHRGFRLTPGQKCGDHDVRGYLQQVNAMKRRFARLAAG